MYIPLIYVSVLYLFHIHLHTPPCPSPEHVLHPSHCEQSFDAYVPRRISAGRRPKVFSRKKNLSGKSRWCFFGRKKVWRLGIESFVFSSFEWAFFPIKWKVIRKKVDFSRFPAKKKKSEKFTKKLGPLLILAVHRFQGFSWVNQPESYGKQLGGPPKPWTHVQLSYIDMT